MNDMFIKKVSNKIFKLPMPMLNFFEKQNYR